MKASILLVEDEERLARFVELELLHEGYQVDKSGNGREALTKALENHYDLILLDIMLPGLNGLEVLRRLLNEKEVPVILLTARDAVMDKVSGLDAGAVPAAMKMKRVFSSGRNWFWTTGVTRSAMQVMGSHSRTESF